MPEPSPAAIPPPTPMPRPILCPYCGEVSADPVRCLHCRGLFEPLSRQASQNSMGPWFIRDTEHPFKPGCSFQTLKALIRRGVVTPATVLRGPTTRQFWTPADRVPSVANLLGRCHACATPATEAEEACTACGASFAPEVDRQFLGLAPVRLLPGQATPEQIAAATQAPPESHRASAYRQEPPVPAALSQSPLAPTPPAPAGRSVRAWLMAGWVVAALSTFALAGLVAALWSGLRLPFVPGLR